MDQNEAVTRVWRSFGDRLRRFIAKQVHHEHDADDILQNVFTRIHAALPGLNDEEKLEAWLFQVTRRAVMDHFRRRRSLALSSEPSLPLPDSDVPSQLASCLRPLMEELDAPDREALRLTDLEGLSQKDLAGRLGLSQTGARSRVQRARGRLKEILLECCEIDLDRRGNALGFTPRHSVFNCL
jgi:RNA polymerase sigma-70 factor (ECF subfamily)